MTIESTCHHISKALKGWRWLGMSGKKYLMNANKYTIQTQIKRYSHETISATSSEGCRNHGAIHRRINSEILCKWNPMIHIHIGTHLNDPVFRWALVRLYGDGTQQKWEFGSRAGTASRCQSSVGSLIPLPSTHLSSEPPVLSRSHLFCSSFSLYNSLLFHRQALYDIRLSLDTFFPQLGVCELSLFFLSLSLSTTSHERLNRGAHSRFLTYCCIMIPVFWGHFFDSSCVPVLNSAFH